MIPLVLDLDGTTVRTDTLVETLLRVLAARPLGMIAALPLALSDRAAFKRAAAASVPLDPASLPYEPAVLDLARRAREDGRAIYLATAADRLVADPIAAHLGLFDGVFASDGHVNLKGAAKARLLVEKFGAQGFDYAGDSMADIPVWQSARHAVLVACSGRVRRAAHAAGVAGEALGASAGPAHTARLITRALRVHQWAKNGLIFVPVLAAHVMRAATLVDALLAFVAFSLCASGVYLLNDLIDLPHDRAHPRKCRRPFASGALKLGWAPGLMVAMLAPVLAICAVLPWRFTFMLALYYACTLSYSFVLKRRAVWDVVMLAGLYTLRIFAGAAATAIPISPWLLAFSLFLFFCLAVVKRLTELTLAGRRQAPDAPAKTLAGRGYGPEDADMLRSMAASSGYMSVMVMALYVNASEVLPLYRHPSALWALCPILLFWVSRVLMLANRGLMDEDPVVFALSDRVSLAVGALALAAILTATL